MKFYILFFLLLTNSLFAQQILSSETVDTKEEAQVIAIIQQLFDGMRENDSTKVRGTLHKEARFLTTFIKNGEPFIFEGKPDDFVKSVGTPHAGVWDEKIWSYDVHIDGPLATVWTEYSFYVTTQLSHCGVNAFQLFKDSTAWKIIQITDTRRKTPCTTTMPTDSALTKDLNRFMDKWHRAAATADEDIFFGSMTEDGIYIGTDASERWLRDELKAWSKKFFDRESAWDFKPYDRVFYFSKDRETAWYEESLETWMGVCRASGVLTKTTEGWKLNHFHLSMAVPNDLVKKYLKILKKYNKKKK